MRTLVLYKRVLFLFFLIITFVSQAFSQGNNKLYKVGYCEYHATDTSRRYKLNTNKENALYFRPVEIDVWYPAKINNNEPALPFHYFLSLFEKRANSFQDSIKYNGLGNELMQYFTMAGNTNIPLKTNSYLNAEKINGQFTAIIYMSAFNGMSYENVPLFEDLASHGYIVISISSIGRYPGNMTTKYPDLLEQVNDADFALHIMRNNNIDTSKIGVIGYSYGGLAASIFAMRRPSVKALLSLDGSEMHYYGQDKDEDKDFDELRQSKYFSPTVISCPYAYIESDHKTDDGHIDSIYHLQSSKVIRNYYNRLIGAEHEDFSVISKPGPDAPYRLVNKLSLDYFDEFLKDKTNVYDTEVANLLAERKISQNQLKIVAAASNRVILTGQIIAHDGNAPIPYVSIGIPAGNCGTVSDGNGKFSLSAEETLLNDTIRISSLGYQSKIFTVKQLSALLAQRPVIQLNEQISQLKEVTISAKKSRIRIVGNTSRSKFFSIGFPLKDLGSEVGIKIGLGRKTVLLRSFNFTISYNKIDSGAFRLNIYSLKKGIPAENLLHQNIIKAIGNKPGNYKIDLTPYHLLLKGNVFVSLEWIAGKNANNKGGVLFSAGLLTSSYYRKTTEATWTHFKGLGAGFNLQVQENEE